MTPYELALSDLPLELLLSDLAAGSRLFGLLVFRHRFRAHRGVSVQVQVGGWQRG